MAHPLTRRAALYRTIWRWHFYAGLFVIPFILLLAATGAAYLFKPQVERWEERAFRTAKVERVVLPSAQVTAALASTPGARFASYRLPEQAGDAAMVHVAMADGRTMRDIFVSPAGDVMGSLDPERRIMTTLKRVHGQLLLGKRGSWLVELAASWAMVLILSGLYLWWPRDRRLAGIIWPRLRKGRRLFWRDLHAVTGFWISGLALILLATGLPWAGIWGSAFKTARAQLGWVGGAQDWTIGGEAPGGDVHAGHDHQAMLRHGAHQHPVDLNGLDTIILKAQSEPLAFPVIIAPPGAAGASGKPGATGWTIRSDAQNRSLRTTIHFDPLMNRETGRETFADRHPIDQVIGYGIAWHEGQLLGWVNQLIGVLTALGLMLMATSGFILWRRRKPVDALGAPPPLTTPARMGGVVAILLLLATLLPLLAISLLTLWLAERLVLPRLPGLARWLGAPRTASQGLSG